MAETGKLKLMKNRIESTFTEKLTETFKGDKNLVFLDKNHLDKT